jgi:Xaa-Pro aminopeptidase
MAQKTTLEPEQISKYPALVDTRLEQLRFSLEDHKVEALVITHVQNIRYLTNFSGSSAFLFITEEEIHFVTDDRYEEQIKNELYPLPGLHTYITRDPWELVREQKMFKDVTSIAFEANRLSYSEATVIRNMLRPLKFKPAPDLVERFTMPKAPEELAYIKKACDISELVYQKILDIVKPGMTEKELSIEIACLSRHLGSEGDAFDIIAVSGERCALIHGKPSDRKIKKNDIVLIDFGCIVNGFRSDLSRTFAVGKATREQKDLYKVIFDAKELAIDSVRPGMNGKILDEMTRNYIKKSGYEPYLHGLGHGIGIEAHEMPSITFRKDDQIIPDSATIAIEPGVYLPDKYGMRIEDVIQVTRSGGRHISRAPDKLPIV